MYRHPSQAELDRGRPRASVIPMPTGLKIEARVLFLDFDGVMITARSHLAFGTYGGSMVDPDPIALALIRKVCDTGVRIVVSSTWRFKEARFWAWMDQHELRSYLHRDWSTPDSSRNEGGIFVGKPRGNEIGAWLAAHPEVRSYRILDDEDGMLPEQLPYFIKCHGHEGISYQGARDLLTWAGVIKPREAA